MIRHRSFLLVAFAALLAASCELIGPAGPAARTDAAVVTAAPPADRAPVTIADGGLDGTTLRLAVGYSGGCAPHTFRLHASPQLNLSIPPSVDLHLGHDDGGDLCEAFLHETLRFDLRPALAAWRAAGVHGPLVLLVYGGDDDPPFHLSIDV